MANVSNQIHEIDPPIDIKEDVYQFDNNTAGETYSLKYFNSSNVIGLYSLSGELTTGDTFRCDRYKVINATADISTSKNKINVSFPVTVP
jgi:hypothetical protein